MTGHPLAAALALNGDTFRDIAAGLGSIITGGAVLVGGWWAWFKFLKGRTYKPRMAVQMAGQWRTLDSGMVFHTRIRLTNIGASKVALRQRGTGLRVSLPADKQPQRMGSFVWRPLLTHGSSGVPRIFEIFKEHAWVEPGETISDDLFLRLGPQPVPLMLEVRLVWSMGHDDAKGKQSNAIAVFAREIFPPDSVIGNDSSTNSE